MSAVRPRLFKRGGRGRVGSGDRAVLVVTPVGPHRNMATGKVRVILIKIKVQKFRKLTDLGGGVWRALNSFIRKNTLKFCDF